VASPLVWRELLQFGGRRLLIGGAAEFQEYVYGYYGLTSQMSSCYMIAMAKENAKMKQQVFLNKNVPYHYDRLSGGGHGESKADKILFYNTYVFVYYVQLSMPR